MRTRRFWIGAAALTAVCGLALAPVATAAPSTSGLNARSVATYWTAARMAAAIPRDIVGDASGWYMPGADGRLHRYGAAGSAPIVSKGKPGGGGGGGGTVANAVYPGQGTVQKAAGRLFFLMGASAYVCSATVVDDALANASVILTAAHCVYDESGSGFASYAMFIPDQSASGTHTDTDCSNDFYGCWIPTQAFVYTAWAENLWPYNIPYDYGFYVVPTTGAHQGTSTSSDSLEAVVGSLPISWSAPTGTGAYTDALGYSYSKDPNFMYCAQTLGAIVAVSGYTNWWLSSCGLSGGASGGPWMQPSSGTTLTGNESVMAVNSWGYSGRKGMAGPKLQDATPHLVYNVANGLASSSDVLKGNL